MSTSVDQSVAGSMSDRSARPRACFTAIAVITLLGAALRLGYVLFVVKEPYFAWTDPDRYVQHAGLLVDDGGWRWTIEAVRYAASYFKAPLYPVFLSAFALLPFRFPLSAAVGQALIGAAVVPAVYWLGRTLHSPRAGLLAAAGAAFFWPSVAGTSAFMQEGLYLPLVAWGLAALAYAVTSARASAAVLAGGLLGVSALTRSMPAYFVVAVALLWPLIGVDSRVARRHALLLCVTFALVTVPYSLYLSNRAGRSVVIEDVGRFMLDRENPALAAAGVGPVGMIWHRFTEEPVAFVREHVDRARGLFYMPGGRSLQSRRPTSSAGRAWWEEWLMRGLGDVPLALVVVLAPIGLLIGVNRRAAAILALWIGLHVGLTVAAGYAGPRFRVPLDPALFSLAGCALAGPWRWPRPGRVPVAAAVALFLLAVPSMASSLPGSLRGRVDYGLNPWTFRATSRQAFSSGSAGFSAWTLGRAIRFRLRPLEATAPSVNTTVRVWVDGYPVDRLFLDAIGREVRYPRMARGFGYVELRGSGPGGGPAPFNLEVYDLPRRAPTEIILDHPVGTVAGIVRGSGWAYRCGGSVSEYRVLVDDVARAIEVVRGGARPDVRAARMDRCAITPLDTGFRFDLDADSLGPGRHRVAVEVDDDLGVTTRSAATTIEVQ